LAKGGIALANLRFYSPGGSSNLQLHVLAGGSTPKSPFLLGVRDPMIPSNAVCHKIPEVYLPNGI